MGRFKELLMERGDIAIPSTKITILSILANKLRISFNQLSDEEITFSELAIAELMEEGLVISTETPYIPPNISTIRITFKGMWYHHLRIEGRF
jgi:hypothetical protein